MLLPHNSVVAVADGTSLKLYRNAGREGDLSLEAIESPTLHSGGPSSGGRHHSSTANPDHRLLDEDAFAASAAAWLQSEVTAGRIASLFVIASPRTLGEMRKHYSTTLEAALVGEAAKELVNHNVDDVAAVVNGVK